MASRALRYSFALDLGHNKSQVVHPRHMRSQRYVLLHLLLSLLLSVASTLRGLDNYFFAATVGEWR